MLLKLFKNNRVGGILFILIIGLGLWMPLFTRIREVPSYSDMPFYNLLFKNISLYPLLSQVLAFLIIAITAIMLFRLNIRFFLIQERSYMPATFFLLISSVFPEMHHISPQLIGSLFIMIMLAMLLAGYNAEKNALHFFNISVILVIGMMFYAKLIWFIPLYWIILLTIRQPGWREIIYPLVAVFLLFIFLFTWNVFFSTGSEFLKGLNENLRIEGTWHSIPTAWMYFLGFVALLIILSSFFILQRFQVRKIYIRNFYQALFFTFVYALLFFLFISGRDYKTIFIAALPLSYLLANYFHMKRNRFTSELMLWILLFLIAWVQIDFIMHSA